MMPRMNPPASRVRHLPLVAALSLALCPLPFVPRPLISRALAQDDYSYQTLMEEAAKEFAANNFLEARGLYERALRKYQTGIAYYGLSLCAYQLRDYRTAVRNGRLATAAQQQPLDAAQRGQILGVVQESMRYLGEYRVRLTPPDAELAVDGEPVELEPDGNLLLPVGRHSIHALAAGYMPNSLEIQTHGGDRRELVLELRPPNAADSAALAEAEDDEEDDGGSDFPVVPVILVSTGAALGIAGAITGILAVDNEGDLEDACGNDPENCPLRFRSSKESADDLALATNVLWVAGGLITAVGLTWLILELSDDEEEPAQLGVDVGRDGGRLMLRGAF